ncbi:MAG: hypothetical protein JRD68_02565 [Deltaproteobacteria bacterium]|nr:hypothetical protein [Deltaproteobacteria bacterium]
MRDAAMLQDGADLKAVSQLMGQSSTHITSEVYYHLLDGKKRQALDNLPIPSVFSTLSIPES